MNKLAVHNMKLSRSGAFGFRAACVILFTLMLALCACTQTQSGASGGDSASSSSSAAAPEPSASQSSSTADPAPSSGAPKADSDGPGIVDAEYVAALDGQSYLVDTRTAEEYYEGHIPGALNASYPKSAGNSGTTEDKDAVFRENWAKLNIDPDAHVVLYCRTGKRAAAAAAVLIEDGYTNVDLYKGSWIDWVTGKKRLIER